MIEKINHKFFSTNTLPLRQSHDYELTNHDILLLIIGKKPSSRFLNPELKEDNEQ
jgi:hypothetical protein